MGCCESGTEGHNQDMRRDNKKGFGAFDSGALEINEKSISQVQKEIGDEYWSSYSDLESADESNAGDINNSDIDLDRKGPTKNLFKQSVMDHIVRYCSDSVREIYKERGPFAFKKHEVDTDVVKTDKRNITQTGDKTYYLG